MRTYLKVAPDYEEIDTVPTPSFAGLGDGGVDGVECAMALPSSQRWCMVRRKTDAALTQPSIATRTPCVSNVLVAI